MQYHHIQTLVKHLFDKDSFEQVSVQELKQFTDDYPFAAVGQFLYAKKLKDAGSYNHYEQSEQASLYFHNALWLRWLLNQKEEVIPVAARAEEAAQQPGFRIVVQMPKAVSEPQPAERRKEPVFNDTNDDYNVNEPVTEQAAAPPVESIKEEVAAPETNGIHKEEISVQEEVQPVAEETAPVTAERTPVAVEEINTVSAGAEENAVVAAEGTEAASAVAIAEISQLAEESKTETAVNAVSITEEALAQVAGSTETAATGNNIVAAEAITEQAAVAEQSAAENLAQPQPTPQITDAVTQVTGEAVGVEESAQTDRPVQVSAAVNDTAAQPEQKPAAVTSPAAVEEKEVVAEAAASPVKTEDEIIAESQLPEPVETTQVVSTPPRQVGGPGEAAQAVSSPPPQVGGPGEAAIVDLAEPIFESYHTIDYFASQGIKLQQDDFKDRLGKQLKSFTDWLRSMKRIGPIENNTSLDEVTNQSIQRIAEHSVEEKEVLTEAMAEVWAKQGHIEKAIRVYEKLSLLNPAKSPYFAGRIEQLKAL